MMSMAVAEFIAQVYGCKLDLASVHPCIVGGRDIGHDLLTLGMMGYFLFVTMPGVVAVIARLGHRRADPLGARAQHSPPASVSATCSAGNRARRRCR